MKTSIQAAFAVVALFALTACGGGGGGGGGNTAARTQPGASEPVDWRYRSEDGHFSVEWDGMAMSYGYRGGSYDMPSNAALPSPVPDRLVFENGLALGAIAGDRALTQGEVDIWIEVPERELWFSFQFPGTRLNPYFGAEEPIHNVRRTLTGWQWQDSEGRGSLIRRSATNNTPAGIYGVESYDNHAGEEVNTTYFGQISGGYSNTDPTSPQPLPPPPPEPIDWSFDSSDGNLSVAWDGADISISYYRGGNDMPINAVFPSFVPDTLTFTNTSLAWGAIAGDRSPTFGSVDIALSVLNSRLAFDFEFPGTRLDSPVFTRDLTGWQWQDSDGAGSLTRTSPTNNAPVAIYGVESYDNSAGVEVQAAYQNVVDNYVNP